MTRPVRVLLLWPGTTGAAAGNFGVPQLVLMATYAREQTGAEVHIRDLVCEAAMGEVRIDKLLDATDGADRGDGHGYDIIGFSVYSSFDHLKCHALAQMARELAPNAIIAAGGYHASARPDHFVYDGSPFDVCVVGEGERTLVTMIESVQGGAPLRHTVLGPDSVSHLGDLPSSDWTYLDRYKSVAHRVASQAQVYLSRGCPFDCAFCMERAKRDVSWRPVPVEQAVHEIVSLHEYLDLRGWTLYVADALFGMKKSWRRAFLERLAAADLPIDKIWLLIRVDLVEEEDLELFDAAGCGLGFGLESGDPSLLAAIRKAGRLDDYLQRMTRVARWAREHDVPWGANIICGHPGETEQTMRTSAAYMKELFLTERGTTGFLSIDPFRLYPGSPIDAEQAAYTQRYGTRFHRPEWWNDGDPAFLSEWIDPSAELDWLQRERLQAELFEPICAQIEQNFVYDGPARDYFVGAIRDQVEQHQEPHRMYMLDRYFAWSKYLGRAERATRERATHEWIRHVHRDRRRELVPRLTRLTGVAADSALMRAIIDVPRERFVPLDQTEDASRDVALALDDSGDATISALHAYVLTFGVLDVRGADRVLDLGAGCGYGSALLARLVGPRGRVVAVELDSRLGPAASLPAHVRWVVGDATDVRTWDSECNKVAVGFALRELPEAWASALPEGAVVVAPVGEPRQAQRLVRATVVCGRFEREDVASVRYVRTRHVEDLPVDHRPRTGAASSAAPGHEHEHEHEHERRRLPIV